MKLVTTGEMRQLERAANDSGHSYAAMMERAGQATALAIKERLATEVARVLVLVGPGNNGGDGLAAARYLHEWGHKVTVYIWKRELQEDPNLARAQELGLPILWAAEDGGWPPSPPIQSGASGGWGQLEALVREADVLVDALLGTGVTGPLRGTLRELLSAVQRALSRGVQLNAPTGRSSVRVGGVQANASPLRGILDGPAEREQRARPLVVAVDVPSGLNCDTGEIDPLALRADLTVTFAYPKRGHFLFPGAGYVGELLVADIGIAPTLAEGLPDQVATPELVACLLPPRSLDAHKGTFGKALIVAGSANYTGAPCLAAEAAYRSGAGLVTLAVAEAIYPIVAGKLTEATYLLLPHELGALVPEAWQVLAGRAEGYDALLVGPGLGREPATGNFLFALLSGRRRADRGTACRARTSFASTPEAGERLKLPPMVIDADGLNLLAGRPRWWESLPTGSVLTPHPGEMARLLGGEARLVEAERISTARDAAQRWGCTVVLKGAYTVVASAEGRTTLIPFANPALATAGTGDVLAGAIVGLMAQGLPGYQAALCGAYLHGLAGELRRKEIGPAGMLAGDLLPLLPLAIRQLSTSSR
jgi:NAD(P)H-hydrate epimerase